MELFPPIPSWDAAHPIVVHLPLGALPLAAVFVVLAMLTRERWSRAMAVSALIALLVGTGGAFLAVMTGEAAGELAEGPGPLAALADPVLEDHEELGELARTVFAVLSGVYVVAMIAGGALHKKSKRKIAALVYLVFLLLYLPALVLLADAAHLGGRLVHEFGIHAPIARDTGAVDRPAPQSIRQPEDDDD